MSTPDILQCTQITGVLRAVGSERYNEKGEIKVAMRHHAEFRFRKSARRRKSASEKIIDMAMVKSESKPVLNEISCVDKPPDLAPKV